ncbi:hypothetical protein GF324_11750 [bacterium]|nr:hypothetical protein [bacterium]
MHLRTVYFLFILFFVPASVLAHDIGGGMLMDGFADIYHPIYEKTTDQNQFRFGQVEIDLEAPVAEDIHFEAAIAFNPNEQTFGVGAFLIDFDIFGSQGRHMKSAFGIDHTGIAVGQMDVPFGIDWQVYPSPDRQLVSAPMIVEEAHGLWNDTGIEAYTTTSWFNVVGFLMNGFGYERTTVNNDTLQVETARSMGARFGVMPHWRFEVGASWAGFFNVDNAFDQQMIGADLQWNLDAFEIKGEYIYRETGLDLGENKTLDGWYGQVRYRLQKLYGVARYGRYSPLIDSLDEPTRFSIGLGYVPKQSVQFRTEYQLNDPAEDVLFLQVVVSF